MPFRDIKICVGVEVDTFDPLECAPIHFEPIEIDLTEHLDSFPEWRHVIFSQKIKLRAQVFFDVIVCTCYQWMVMNE